MRMYDLITAKKNGREHTREELEFIVNGFVNGSVPDYQMSAWMMAVCLKGMTDQETAILTDVMAHSGDMVDLSPIQGIKVDKHSTGGVGDKTTLVITPIVAACGVKMAKMSGRGLGFTGGTLDKLEAIPGTPPNMILPPKGDAFAARNKYAMQIDFEEQPPMFRVSDTHTAATWLMHPNAPKVEPPAIVRERIERMKRRQTQSANEGGKVS